MARAGPGPGIAHTGKNGGGSFCFAANKTSVVSEAKTYVVSAATKAATSAATSDISIPSTTPCEGVVDKIEISDLATDVAAFLAALLTVGVGVGSTPGGGELQG